MKITDTIGLVLKSKGESRVLSIAPEQSVYEAIVKMAEYDIGALLVLYGSIMLLGEGRLAVRRGGRWRRLPRLLARRAGRLAAGHRASDRDSADRLIFNE